MHVAPQFADELVARVARKEGKLRHRAIYGEHYQSGPFPGYCLPEACAEADRKWEPVHDLLRQWCGQGVVERYDQVRALRDELRKLVRLNERAIEVLRAAGATGQANKLARELAAITLGLEER